MYITSYYVLFISDPVTLFSEKKKLNISKLFKLYFHYSFNVAIQNNTIECLLFGSPNNNTMLWAEKHMAQSILAWSFLAWKFGPPTSVKLIQMEPLSVRMHKYSVGPYMQITLPHLNFFSRLQGVVGPTTNTLCNLLCGFVAPTQQGKFALVLRT